MATEMPSRIDANDPKYIDLTNNLRCFCAKRHREIEYVMVTDRDNDILVRAVLGEDGDIIETKVGEYWTLETVTEQRPFYLENTKTGERWYSAGAASLVQP